MSVNTAILIELFLTVFNVFQLKTLQKRILENHFLN